MNEDIRRALYDLAEEIKEILSERIQKYGANRKGENTLIGSNLEKSIEVTVQDNGVSLKIADYWWYVASGWKKTGRSGVRGLYHELVLWALRKHIMVDGHTQNESAVIIAEKVWTAMIVYGRPIPPRPFMIPDEKGDLTNMIPELKSYMDEWFDKLFEDIITDLEIYFNS